MYRNFPYHFVRGMFEKMSRLLLARQVEKLARRLARWHAKLKHWHAVWHVGT